MKVQRLVEMTHVHVEVGRNTKIAVAKISNINTFSDCAIAKKHKNIAECSQFVRNHIKMFTKKPEPLLYQLKAPCEQILNILNVSISIGTGIFICLSFILLKK